MAKVALCLSGAGSRGILTLGYLKAWNDFGMKYDTLHGTSSGALNASLYHQGDMDQLEKLWMSIGDRDVFDINPLHWMNPFTTKNSIGSAAPLRKLVYQNMDPAKVKAQDTPCYINTTDVTDYSALSYDLRELDTKDEMTDFVLASASPPIAFPPVEFRGLTLYDGGLVNNFSIVDAINKGADIIIECRPAIPELPYKKVTSLLDAFNVTTGIPSDYALSRELHFVTMINKIQADYDKLREIKVVIVKPDKPIPFSFLDFSYKGYDRKQLIQLGYDTAMETFKRELC